jgi:hypothetical protein
MYLATKEGSSCRIPERKKAYYESMGYVCTDLDAPEVGVKKQVKEPAKSVKSEPKE